MDIPFGTYDLVAFPWFKRLAFAALIVNAVCFLLLVARKGRPL